MNEKMKQKSRTFADLIKKSEERSEEEFFGRFQFFSSFRFTQILLNMQN